MSKHQGLREMEKEGRHEGSGTYTPFQSPEHSGAGALVPILQMSYLRAKYVGQDPPNQEVRERQGWVI